MNRLSPRGWWVVLAGQRSRDGLSLHDTWTGVAPLLSYHPTYAEAAAEIRRLKAMAPPLLPGVVQPVYDVRNAGDASAYLPRQSVTRGGGRGVWALFRAATARLASTPATEAEGERR